eukprot:scaffold24494_cov64-Skeletonema_dohrnii-CCMP3373.AAC.1
MTWLEVGQDFSVLIPPSIGRKLVLVILLVEVVGLSYRCSEKACNERRGLVELADAHANSGKLSGWE